MNDNYINARIFISSTFKDMQLERDCLKKQVLPRLKQALLEYNIDVSLIDLRWGINTNKIDQEEKRENKILKVCFETINNNRPFFIGILGDRYGWIPPKSRLEKVIKTLDVDTLAEYNNKSVTELEIIHGAIGNPQFLNGSLFYFRQLDYADAPATFRNDYNDAFDPELQESYAKLQVLKKEISTICEQESYASRIKDYHITWKEGSLGGYDAFEELVFQDLFNLIKTELAGQVKTANKTWEEKELSYLETFIYSKTKYFEGRNEIINTIIAFLQAERYELIEKQAIFISAPSGYGKSAVFSQVYKIMTSNCDEKTIILAHSAGVTEDSDKIQHALKRWIFEINKKSGLNYQIPEDIDLNTYFKTIIWHVQLKGYKIVVLLDSLESFIVDDFVTLIQHNFDIFPTSIRFVCTSTEGYVEHICNTNYRFRLMKIEEFERGEALQMINSLMRDYHKELNKEIENALLNIKKEDGTFAYNSPLWVRLAIMIFLEFDSSDFDKINHSEGLENERIDSYMLHLAKNLPSEPEDLFLYLLDMGSRFFNSSIFKDIIAYIALSPDGVTQENLEILLGDKWNTLSFVYIRRWLSEYLSDDNKDKKWNFTHKILRKATLKNLKSQELFAYRESLKELHIKDRDLNNILIQSVYTADIEVLKELFVNRENVGDFDPVDTLIHMIIKGELDNVIEVLRLMLGRYDYEYSVADTIRRVFLKFRNRGLFLELDSQVDIVYSKEIFNVLFKHYFHNKLIYEDADFASFLSYLIDDYIKDNTEDISPALLDEIINLYRKIIKHATFNKSCNFFSPSGFHKAWIMRCYALAKEGDNTESLLLYVNKFLDDLVLFYTKHATDDWFLYSYSDIYFDFLFQLKSDYKENNLKITESLVMLELATLSVRIQNDLMKIFTQNEFIYKDPYRSFSQLSDFEEKHFRFMGSDFGYIVENDILNHLLVSEVDRELSSKIKRELFLVIDYDKFEKQKQRMATDKEVVARQWLFKAPKTEELYSLQSYLRHQASNRHHKLSDIYLKIQSNEIEDYLDELDNEYYIKYRRSYKVTKNEIEKEVQFLRDFDIDSYLKKGIYNWKETEKEKEDRHIKAPYIPHPNEDIYIKGSLYFVAMYYYNIGEYSKFLNFIELQYYVIRLPRLNDREFCRNIGETMDHLIDYLALAYYKTNSLDKLEQLLKFLLAGN